MPVRYGGHAALTAQGAPVESCHLRVQSGLVDEDQAPTRPMRLGAPPAPPRHSNIRSLLLGGVRRFFITQPESIEPMPQRRQADLHVKLLAATLLQLHQGQIRLGGNASPQSRFMLLQPGDPIAADLLRAAVPASLVLLPESHHTLASHPKALANLTGTSPIRPRLNNTLTQILAQRSHNLVLMRRSIPKGGSTSI